MNKLLLVCLLATVMLASVNSKASKEQQFEQYFESLTTVVPPVKATAALTAAKALIKTDAGLVAAGTKLTADQITALAAAKKLVADATKAVPSKTTTKKAKAGASKTTKKAKTGASMVQYTFGLVATICLLILQ